MTVPAQSVDVEHDPQVDRRHSVMPFGDGEKFGRIHTAR
jgi:hypothetical protein